MDVAVYNMKGDEVGSMPIDEVALGEVINPALIKQAYVMYHANLRQGSARTKNRGEVSGNKQKIYKQKGTGRARHGTKRPPQFRGGGHYKTKRRTREDYRVDMPKKMRRKANLNALLAKFLDNEVKVVDSITVETPKTKVMVDMLAALGVGKSVLLALPAGGEGSEPARRSARNVEHVTLCRADQLTCFELLNHRYLVIERAQLEAFLAGPWSQTDKSAKVEPRGRELATEGFVRERKPRPKRGHAVKAAAWAAKKNGTAKTETAAAAEGEG